MPHPQAAFARAVLNELITNPAHHNQTHWGLNVPECGTSLCVAGTAVVMDPNTHVVWTDNGDHGAVMQSLVWVKGGEYDVHIAERAAFLLGIEDEDFSHELFFDSDEAEAIELLERHVLNLEAMP